MTPASDVSLTGSSIEFLQDLHDTNSTFDSAISTGYSAFRIRHDTINGLLIFEGTSGSQGPYQLMTLNDDTNTVTFGGTVAFEDISFDQITGSHIYVGTSSRLLGTTSISFLSMTSSLGTASIWYDGTQMHIDGFTSGGNSWKTQYKITASYNSNSYYTVYTSSATQVIQDYNYLSVFLNGALLYASGSIAADWDYQTGSSLTTPSIKFKYNLPYTQQDEWWLGYVYSGGSD